MLPRLRQLPPQAGALARAVAVLGSGAELRRVADLAGLDPDTAVETVDALVAAELLAPGRPLSFTHPLVGDAIAGAMSAAERHRGHLRAARCLADEGAGAERVAAHLLAVERLGDPWVVARLRAAAAAAVAKAAAGAAVTYLRRAVVEPAPCTDLPELLVDLGTAQLSAGDGDGNRTLRAAWESATDPVAAGRVALAVSRVWRSGGSYRPAEEVVTAAVVALGATEPDLVAELQTELALAERVGSAPGWPTAARVRELVARADARGDGLKALLLRQAALSPLRDPDVGPAATALAAEVLARASLVDLDDVGAFYTNALVLFVNDRPDTVLPAVTALVDAARRRGRVLEVGIATTLRAQALYQLGRVREAEEDARLVDRLVAGGGPQKPQTHAFAGHLQEIRRHPTSWLLHCLVERGLPAEGDAALSAAGVPVTSASLLVARARLRLLQDRPADALADLEECGHRLVRRRVMHPNFVPWQPWSAVALLRLGREDEARARVADALTAARRFRSVRAEGVALWASGLVERSADVLAEAVDVLRRVPAPLEQARALVDLGAALRRANHRADARAPLEAALQLAHECGADATAATATLELAAAGVHVRRPAVTGPNALTPAERRIAERAATGATNREIAQELFVTPKTVENHLSNAYRKLGVTGRAGLPAALQTAT